MLKIKENEKKEEPAAFRPTKAQQAARQSKIAQRMSRVSVSLDSRRSRYSMAGIRMPAMVWQNTGKGYKVPKYQNSYRLEPHLPFRFEVSDTILAGVMKHKLRNKEYDTKTAAKLALDIAMEVRERLYKTDFDRVKYVVWIAIAENTGQSMYIGHGRLWDAVRDTYSTYEIQNNKMYAAGLVSICNYE